MRRRDFIAGLSAAAVVWPQTARTQEPGKVFGLGYLESGPRTDPTSNSFMPGLRKLGYAEERNLRIEERTARAPARCCRHKRRNADPRRHAGERKGSNRHDARP
jgi:hypothetical protein